jgi:transglutaminase-like putative cysteine protease
MSWRMRVRHTTTYRYSAEVHASYNEARISPLDTPNQFTLEHRVEVHPAANLFRYRDYWGSRVHVFDLHQPHTELTVVGSSLVETAERTPTLDDTVAWDAIDAPGLTDRFFEFMTETTMTGSDDAIRQVARELRERPGPAAALSRLGEWLRAHVEYETGTTSVSTTAVEVLRAGRGVCQDYAGALRVGLPVSRRARRGGRGAAPG